MGLGFQNLQFRTSRVKPHGAWAFHFLISRLPTSIPNPMALDLFAFLNLPTSATNGYCTIDSGATMTIPDYIIAAQLVSTAAQGDESVLVCYHSAKLLLWWEM